MWKDHSFTYNINHDYFQQPGYTCQHDHVKTTHYDEDGTVCHCYDDRCNVEVPDLDSKAANEIMNIFLILSSLIIVLVFGLN